MPFEFHFDDELGLYRGRWSGRASLRSLIDAVTDSVAETRGDILRKPLLHIIETPTAFDDLDLSDLHLIREGMADYIAHDPSSTGAHVRAAFVVPAPEVSAVVHLWQQIVGARPSMGREVRSFTSEDEAIAWLKGS